MSLATPLGAISTILFSDIPVLVLGSLSAMAAGGFIYIGASDLVPEAHKKYSLFNILLVLAGIFFVFFAGKFLE